MGPAEVLIILVVALLVLGPKKLPEAARQIGKAMSEFRRVTSGLQNEVRHVLDDHMEPTPLAVPPAEPPPFGDNILTPPPPPPADPAGNGDGNASPADQSPRE